MTSTAGHRCRSCGCGLRRGHGGALCDPCARTARVYDRCPVPDGFYDTPNLRAALANYDQAERDRAQRQDAIARLEAELERIKQARERDRTKKVNGKAKHKAQAAHSKAECALRDHPTLGRWLRQSPSGRLSINRAKIKQEQRLDGKYLIATSDPHISAEDTALGYKNLLEAERGFRDLKSSLLPAADLPPARAPHPRPRPALLARVAPGSGRRTPHQHDLAGASPPTSAGCTPWPWSAAPAPPCTPPH